MANDPQPLARPGRVHEYQAFAGPPANLTPAPQVSSAVYPSWLPGRPARAHEMQAWAGPRIAAVAAVPRPVPPVYPSQLRGRPARAHEMQFLGRPARFVTPVAPAVPGFGSAGAATLVLSLQPGAKVTYGWHTSITPAYDGSEQREGTIGPPRRSFEGTAFLLDGADRDVKGSLMRAAAQGATFLLALPFEELGIMVDSPNSVLSVGSTTACDWALVGQRIVIVGVSGAVVYAVIQSVTASTISIVIVNAAGNFVFGSLGTTGRAGGRVMPLAPVLLESTQGFARYPVTVALWSLRAGANAFGWCGQDSMGVGTTITTISDPIPIAELTDEDVLIWDRPNAIDGTASESMISRTELVDLGGLTFSIGGADVPDWSRSVKLRSASRDDFQWLKAFLHATRGQQVPFLLSTNRPDLVFDSATAGGIKIKSAATLGGGDYVSWFASDSHKRLAITAGGVVQYATVSVVVDNGDGTLTLTLDAAPTGTITKISFLEQVRFARDEIEVSWNGAVFSIDETVVTVQETVVTPPARPMFDTVIENCIRPPFPSGTMELNQIGCITAIPIPLGDRSIVIMLESQNATIGAITAASGNVDGMLLMLTAPVPANRFMELVSEWTGAVASSRIRFPSSVTSWSGQGGLLLVYCGAISRWLLIGKAP